MLNNISKKKEEQLKKEDEKVAKMIEKWDIVRCRICGKEISMLDGRLVKNGSYYICRNHQ